MLEVSEYTGPERPLPGRLLDRATTEQEGDTQVQLQTTFRTKPLSAKC